MFEKIFELITSIGRKYKLDNNPIVMKIIPYYQKIMLITSSKSYVSIKPGDRTALSFAQQNDFLAQNAERIKSIANMLTDEKSRKTYLGMVKFRQTCKKEDFPISCFEKTEYIIEEFKFSKDEVFIDCGAYIGDTVNKFLKRCPDYKQIVAFEPEQKNFKKLKAKYGNNTKITLINAGAYDRDGIVNFAGMGLSGTIIAGGGSKRKE